MIFLTEEQVKRIHQANIERFGGAQGLRDQGAFESALLAARNRYDYEEADVVACAATYGFHLCQAHAFVDGNKRVAAATMLIYLELNGAQHSLSSDDVITIFLSVAASQMTRDELEAFLRAYVR
ncbi:type II toxin-antitoxin system death-on-curing family toxin [bacterium]|nr:MAG: type II toxin-antitoxin system death-on-curing family toxin [bacterium]